MKIKNIINTIMGIGIILTSSNNLMAEDSIHETILKEINFESEIFKNSIMSDEDINIENQLIQRMNEVYFDKENYNEDSLHEIFVNFILLGFNNAAFKILNNDNVNIDINKANTNGIKPIIASAISNIEGGNVEMAKYLLDKGANPNETVKNNIPAISLAAVQDNYKVVSLLILNNANFMAKDNLEMYPIDHAFKNNSEKSALIIKNALDIHIENIRNK